jgi:hypothetical protein
MKKSQKLARALQILHEIQGENDVEISVGHDVLYLGDCSFHTTPEQEQELEILGLLKDEEFSSYYMFI